MPVRIVIIGGGASGLAAAITAARQDADVTILEHKGIDEIRNTDTLSATIYEEIYRVNQQNRCSSQLYLLDSNGELLWSVSDGGMDFLLQPEYRQWGILRQIRQNPENVSTYFQNGYWCMGCAVLDKGGRFLGYMVVGLSQQECAGMLTGIYRQFAITGKISSPAELGL